jgi:hypothetical protein
VLFITDASSGVSFLAGLQQLSNGSPPPHPSCVPRTASSTCASCVIRYPVWIPHR